MKLPAARHRASAVIVVLALLGILSLYVLVNVRTLTRLKHDVKQIELRQLQRLQAAKPALTPPLNATTNQLNTGGTLKAGR